MSREDTVCTRAGADHDFERVKESWAEIIDRCRRCGFEIVARAG